MNQNIKNPVILRWYAFACVGLVLGLTLFLFLNGGAHNPFSILFIAIGSVAAMYLSRWSLVIVITLSLVCLWVIYSGSGEMPHHADASYNMHLRGMWLANSLGVLVVTSWIYYLRVQNESLAQKHQEAQRILFHLERVDSLGRLLAMTAHKLNTPLATMQLGVSELSNQKQVLSEIEKNQWLEDLQKALKQVSDILVALKSREDTLSVEKYENEALNFVEYLETLASRWAATRNASVQFQSDISSFAMSQRHLPQWSAGLEAVFENSYDARPPQKNLIIEITLKKNHKFMELIIKDNGIGMDAAVLRQAGEPLFTTKKSGTGLGLYIFHQLARQFSGALILDSQPRLGTQVKLSFDAALLAS